MSMEDYNKALELYQEAYEKQRKILGENHPDTLVTLNNLAYTYSYIWNNEKALELFKELYEKLKETLGEDNPKTLKIKKEINNLMEYFE